MKPIEFDEQSAVLGKPASMTDKECSSLPCFRDGVNVISKWELTEEELEEIKKTKCIYVNVLSGKSSPPIKPDVFTPFMHN
ncbi:hypothetical protein KAR91_34905 [Candidatus Pacearchaeota archaeon]|nr:hypothetical protein [Candidatus Pacearchaeota archaeon]